MYKLTVQYFFSVNDEISQQEPSFFTDFIVQGNMADSHERRQPNLQRIMGTPRHVTS